MNIKEATHNHREITETVSKETFAVVKHQKRQQRVNKNLERWKIKGAVLQFIVALP